MEKKRIHIHIESVKAAEESVMKKLGDEEGKELLETVKEYADVKTKISNSLDEIEEITQDLFDRQNQLAKKINEVIDKLDENSEENELENEEGLARTLEKCSDTGAPCTGCPLEGKDNGCMSELMKDAADAMKNLIENVNNMKKLIEKSKGEA